MKSLFDISGKRALITGAARGIGLTLAKGLIKAGATVAIIDIVDDVEQIASKELGDMHMVFKQT